MAPRRGDQVLVVDLDRRVERPATPEEAAEGVFYPNVDEYKRGKSLCDRIK